jgi:hypothetical protein
MKRGPKPKQIVERFWRGVNKHGKKMPHVKTRCWGGTVV